MRKRSGISAVLVGSILLSSTTGLSADDRLKKDRRRMALGAVGVAASPLVMAAGAFSFNPVVAGAGVAMFGASAGVFSLGTSGYVAHKIQDRRAQAASTNDQPNQVETLLPVPQRPGYYYDPSNPSQFYYNPAEAAEPTQAKIDGPAVETPGRIIVKIANASKDGRTITCTIDGSPFSVPPGYTQILNAAPGSVIAFETGNGAEVQRYTLTEGSFEFRTVENSWRLTNQEPARSVASGSPATNPTTGAPVAR